MSFGLSRGRTLQKGQVGLTRDDLPSLPDTPLSPPTGDALLDPRAWFPHPERPLEIEIGSGKGTFLIQQSTLQPDTNFLGFEWAREFWLYAADRLRRRTIDNVRLVNDDAVEFLHWRCPSAIARVIHLYFSDPWPKTRHHRRRVVQDRFLADAHRILLPGGELRIVTDHDDYWSWMQEHFDRWTRPMSDVGCGMSDVRSPAPDLTSDIPHPTSHIPFQLLPFDPPASADSGELVGTNFERKYRREAGGRSFHAAVLRKPD